MKPALVRGIKLAISITLVAMLYRAANWSQVIVELGEVDPSWLVASLLLFVPQTVVSAWRWQRLVADRHALSLAESLRHTLAASAFNLIMPAKTGDFSKAAWLDSGTGVERAKLGGRILVEKLGDVACLFVCMALGLGGMIGISTLVVVATALALLAWRDTRGESNLRWLPIMASTLVLWSLHLAQVHCFLLAAGVDATWLTTLSRVPLALFAGLIPGTFCGIGTRDSALVWLYADSAPPAVMAVVGLLTSLRYLVPGAAGIAVLATARSVRSSGFSRSVGVVPRAG